MAQATSIVVRLIVTILVITAITGQLAHLDALSEATFGLADTLARNPRPSFLTLVAADAVVSTIAGVLGLALVFRGDATRGARGLGVALACWSYLLAYSGIVVLLRPDPGMLRGLFQAHFPLVEILGLAGMIGFTTTFPHRLVPEDLSEPSSLPMWVRPFQFLRIRLLSAGGLWIGTSLALALLFGINAAAGGSLGDAGLNPFMDLLRFSAVALVVANMRRSWALASPADRGHMGWVTVGFTLLLSALALLIGGNILLSATRWQEPSIAWRPILLDLGLIGFLWGAAMSVFYGGSLRAAAVTRRVVSSTVLATSVLFVATGLEALLSTALVGRIALPVGSGTAVAVLLGVSLHGRSLQFIEKVMAQVSGPDRKESEAI